MPTPGPFPQPPKPRLQADNIIEKRYRIVRLVGIGGMGAVYEAIDMTSDHRVAIKEILFNPDELDPTYFQKLQAAFIKEARVLINLNRTQLPTAGARIPTASDLFRANSIWYLVMEFIEGVTLAEMLERTTRPLAPEEGIKWGIQLAYTLEFLHQQNPPIIHADIKPSNIKIDELGRAALLDFGIAKGGHGYPVAPTTRGTLAFATPHYAAPEQSRAQVLSPATDVFGLSATLYHVVTGERPPRVDDRLYAMALDSESDPLRPAHELNAAVPRFLSQALLQGMALEVLQRPTNAAQFRTMLENRRAEPLVTGPDIADIWGKPTSRYDGVPKQSAAENRSPVEAAPPRVAPVRPAADHARPTPERSPSRPIHEERARPIIPPARPTPPRDNPIPGNWLTTTGIVLLGILVIGLLMLPFLESDQNNPVVAAATDNTATTTPPLPTPNQPQNDGNTENDDIAVANATSTRLSTGNGRVTSTPLRIVSTVPPAPSATIEALPTIVTPQTAATSAPVIQNTPIPTSPPPTQAVEAPTTVPAIRLIAPNDNVGYRTGDQIRFEWGWPGQLQGTQYFDVRVWKEGAPHYGVAAFSNQTGSIAASSLAPGVYYWSVAVVDNGGRTVIAAEAAARRFSIAGDDSNTADPPVEDPPTPPPSDDPTPPGYPSPL